jgi:hypothetical protein
VATSAAPVGFGLNALAENAELAEGEAMAADCAAADAAGAAGAAGLGLVLPAGVPVLVLSAVSVWLMLINCSRLFTFTSWLMYWLGSAFAVGSWFCISVTKSERKSFAEMVAELLLALLLLPLVPLVPEVPLLALGDADAMVAKGPDFTALACAACKC